MVAELILIDSNVLVGYIVDDDGNHDKAVRVMNRIAAGDFGPPLVSDYIFDEITTVTFVKSKSLPKAIAVGNYIREAARLLKVDSDVFEDSWKVFKEQKNSRFSFTDCTNLTLMKENGIKYIATFDKEFKKSASIKVVG